MTDPTKQTTAARAGAGKSPLRALRDVGQSVWLDYIHRGILRSGEFAQLVQDGISGVTSNPTIFEKAITGSSDYDDALGKLVAEGKTTQLKVVAVNGAATKAKATPLKSAPSTQPAAKTAAAAKAEPDLLGRILGFS